MAEQSNKQSIVIVGGGPVGLVLALTMQQQGFSVCVLETRKKGAAYQDQRALALSYGSKLILDKLGVWQKAAEATTAISTIHVSQQGGMGRTKLNANDYDLPALGYVVSYGALMQALDSSLQTEHIKYEATASAIRFNEQVAEVDFSFSGQSQTIKSPLLVIAEGGRSLANVTNLKRKTKSYGHDALVSKVSCELPHHHIAYERFTPMGPMALLPNGKRDFSLVWTGEKASVDKLLSLEDGDFLEALHHAFGDRVGRFIAIEKRMSFPLMKSQLEDNVTPHLAVIGNSAQTMHPVAGQGFNVGLRDATSLANVLVQLPESEWGSKNTLEQYAKLRIRDTKGGLLFTDFLVSIFSNDIVGLSSIRGLGLGLLDVLSPVKAMLVRKMTYGK